MSLYQLLTDRVGRDLIDIQPFKYYPTAGWKSNLWKGFDPENINNKENN